MREEQTHAMQFSLSLTTRYIVGIHKLVAVLEYRRSVTFANEMKIHEKCSFPSAKLRLRARAHRGLRQFRGRN